MSFHELARSLTVRPLQRPFPERRHLPSRFDSSWSSTVDLLARELRAVGARDVVLEADFRESDLRVDGLPRADRRPRSPGVAVSFRASGLHGEPHLRYPCDTFGDWQSNVRAVALALEALRKVDRYGVTARAEQYAGFRALPPGGGEPAGPELARKGREIFMEFGSVGIALRATHPDTRDPASGYTDLDYRAVVAYKESVTRAA